MEGILQHSVKVQQEQLNVLGFLTASYGFAYLSTKPSFICFSIRQSDKLSADLLGGYLAECQTV